MDWPDEKKFAFTIFDDPDAQTEEDSRVVYRFLADLGFRTTKALWAMGPRRNSNSGGDTCNIKTYRQHCCELQALGFELGFHNATSHSVCRDETIESLELFREYFGCFPLTMANHYNEEAMYWGDVRLTGARRAVYNFLTLGRKRNRYFGHVEGHPAFWGDICRKRIRYCRNFVYTGVNTLKYCPWMPYRDPLRPYVNAWYASTEGANCRTYIRALGEAGQDQLESEGGACIMYTHFGHGFVTDGKLHPRFQNLMKRLSRKNGWFAPTAVLLDYLAAKNGITELDNQQRKSLESRWLFEKLFRGTS